MIIEEATVSDAEEILALQKLAYQSEAEIYNDFGISPLVQILEAWRKILRKIFFLGPSWMGEA
jgi:hypothetical protein